MRKRWRYVLGIAAIGPACTPLFEKAPDASWTIAAYPIAQRAEISPTRIPEITVRIQGDAFDAVQTGDILTFKFDAAKSYAVTVEAPGFATELFELTVPQYNASLYGFRPHVRLARVVWMKSAK